MSTQYKRLVETRTRYEQWKERHRGPGGIGTIFSVGDLDEVDCSDYHAAFDDCVEITKRAIILHFTSYDYEIAFNRLKTQTQLLDWVMHLCTKNWMTTRGIHLFVEKVCEVKKWECRGRA